MSKDKAKPAAKTPSPPGVPAAAPKTPLPPTPPSGPVSVPPLFRRIDWLTFLLTFGAVMLGYYLTLAPELTLEDSGELAVGSMYAGIPHPPGYPVWTIYTWLWTVLLPVGNMAWRVALGVAFSSALAAGLLGLLVSRGSSLLIEGIEELKELTGGWEAAICLISGFVAGTLIGFNGYLWSQSVIVEVYAFSVMNFMIVLLFLLRWIYAPHQRRYLYYCFIAFGLCFTNHQTLILAAMGLEVAIAAADKRMGRWFFLVNSVLYLAGLLLKSQGLLTALDANRSIFAIFNAVGIGSIAAYIWFTVLTKETFVEFCMDGLAALSVLFLAAVPKLGFFGGLLGVGAIVWFVKLGWDNRKLGWDWLTVLICGACWAFGVAFYFYMPIAGMSNPPMQWGYPRTEEGFWHALTRGQYEKANPTDVIGDPMRFITQLGMLGSGIVEEFNWVYTFLALVPFFFFKKLHQRERAWLIGITAIYLCLGVLLLIFCNPPPDRAAQDLIRVFFGASHTLIALLVGYGMTLIAAYMATHYARFRFLGLVGGAIGVGLALYSFVKLTGEYYFGEAAEVSLGQIASLTGAAFTDANQFGVPIFAGLMLIGMTVLYVASVLVYRNRAPLLITLGVFALMPAYPVMTHWAGNEQRNHWFGYWFGHDMFTPPFTGADGKPLYPEMTKDAVLYGGTDPGRFCPTYMIFCDSLTDPEDLPKQDQKFDRRDVYIITQNALADGTYLNYIRAHYNRSQQHDLPFFQEFFRSTQESQDNYRTNLLARMVRPLDTFFTELGDDIEKDRRTFTSWFQEDHFHDLGAFIVKLKEAGDKDPVSRFLYENLSDRTREMVASGPKTKGLARALARDLNQLIDRELTIKEKLHEKSAEKARLEADLEAGSTSASKSRRLEALNKEIGELAAVPPLYTPERFQNVRLSEYLQDFIKENPQSHTRVRLNRLLLEAAYPAEIARTKGGVYPDREIQIASPLDSQRCFEEYLQDAQRRLQAGQLKPGEDVRIVDNRVQVSGQVAVMAINGLLTKVMFDKNPKNEFFVEESFPLDWMYPHLTPYGIIMKINRQPLPELTQDTIDKDHAFWTKYSERLIGNWITYDTKVSEIADFVERVYLRRNFKGFTGDRKFVRDDQAQKAFSKLRSSIGGVYNWRIAAAKPGSPDQQRMIKEADFAFRQAFAFCPYSPEAVFRYVNLLLSMQRFDDALIVAETCYKLDPFNGQVIDLVRRLREWKNQRANQPAAAQVQPGLLELEQTVAQNPADFQAAFNLAGNYLQMQQTPRALQILDNILNHPNADAAAFRALIDAYSSMGNQPRVQSVIEKLEALTQSSPTNLEAKLLLAEAYRKQQKPEPAMKLLDEVANHPQLSASTALLLAQQYAGFMNYQKLEATLDKLVKLAPESPEAWYDLAALRASLNKPNEAFEALRRALQLSADRLKKDPKARDLKVEALKDTRFQQLKSLPGYTQLMQG